MYINMIINVHQYDYYNYQNMLIINKIINITFFYN